MLKCCKYDLKFNTENISKCSMCTYFYKKEKENYIKNVQQKVAV